MPIRSRRRVGPSRGGGLSPVPGPDSLREWRQELLTALLRTFAVVGLVALAPGVVASLQGGIPAILIADVAAYLALVPAYLLRRRHYVASAAIVVGLQLLVGGTLMFTVGTDGASMLWMLAPILVAHLLLDTVGIVVVFTISLTLQIATAILLHLDALAWWIPPFAWYAIVGSYVVIAALIVFASRFLMTRLAGGLERERALNHELDHRVKNNLQLMASLVLLQSNDSPHPETRAQLDRFGDRLTAMSSAFRLLDRSSGTLEVPFDQLLSYLVHEHLPVTGDDEITVADGSSVPAFVSIDLAVPVSIILAELMTAAVSLARGRLRIRLDTPVTGRLRISMVVGDDDTSPSALVTDALTRDIVTALVAQISGSLEERTGNGHLEVALQFPVEASATTGIRR